MLVRCHEQVMYSSVRAGVANAPWVASSGQVSEEMTDSKVYRSPTLGIISIGNSKTRIPLGMQLEQL